MGEPLSAHMLEGDWESAGVELFCLATGLAALPSNIAFGMAWDRWGGPPCLVASALGALCSLGALGLWTRRHAAPAG